MGMATPFVCYRSYANKSPPRTSVEILLLAVVTTPAMAKAPSLTMLKTRQLETTCCKTADTS
jgi:hypothetical protein